jgi:hypothetical protein
MKTIQKLLLGMLLLAFLLPMGAIAQDASNEEYKPVYLTVTKGHWSDDPNVDGSDWLKTEQEYFEKVTKKNDLIIGSGFYTHYFTPDNSEILFVSVYASWEDIEKSNDVTNKLIEEGWPNEQERDAFFQKQSSYYSNRHSDEIYMSMKFEKPLKTDSTEPLIFYVKSNETGNGGKGFNEYFENVTMKNQYIKGYYTHRHLWGANSQEADEVFVVENLCDIEKMFDENQKLVMEHWSDAEKRKAFFADYNKTFSGHGDYIYQNVPELAK